MSKLLIVVTGLFLVCSVQKRVTLHPLSRYSHAVTYYPRPFGHYGKTSGTRGLYTGLALRAQSILSIPRFDIFP